MHLYSRHQLRRPRLRDDGSCVFPCVGDINQNIFDWDANGNIGIADFLQMLSVFGDVDVDGDGVWDSQDDCVDLEACNFANDPTEACQYLDILGVCGGGCDVDSDGDGICDDTDTCVGVLDECGVCNGPGPSNIIVEAITVFYDSLYLPLDEEWFVYAVDADTTFAFECPPTTDGCSDPSEEIPPYSLVVEASEPVNPANGTVYPSTSLPILLIRSPLWLEIVICQLKYLRQTASTILN